MTLTLTGGQGYIYIRVLDTVAHGRALTNPISVQKREQIYTLLPTSTYIYVINISANPCTITVYCRPVKFWFSSFYLQVSTAQLASQYGSFRDLVNKRFQLVIQIQQCAVFGGPRDDLKQSYCDTASSSTDSMFLTILQLSKI